MYTTQNDSSKRMLSSILRFEKPLCLIAFEKDAII